jgi:hypothetical protein
MRAIVLDHFGGLVGCQALKMNPTHSGVELLACFRFMMLGLPKRGSFPRRVWARLWRWLERPWRFSAQIVDQSGSIHSLVIDRANSVSSRPQCSSGSGESR